MKARIAHARVVHLSATVVLAGLAGPVRAATGEELSAIPFTDVVVTSPFWKSQRETNRTITIPYVFKKCDELGLTDNFARATGRLIGNRRS